jgi:septum formation protein
MNQPHDCLSLILASKSPRRKHLLEQAGLKFSVIPSEVDETSVAMSDPASYVRALAEFKALDISQKHPDSWIIGADTIVLIGNQILGKPGSNDEAREMLQRLSGKSHEVLTGYCICCREKKQLFSETVNTAVHFKNLRREEIQWYIETGEPLDKAGAYAIQGIGSFLVKSIDGSYTNVVGLPVCEVMEVLIQQGVIVLNSEKLS